MALSYAKVMLRRGLVQFTKHAWIAGTMPKSPIEQNNMARNARYLLVESVGESIVAMVNTPMAVIPAR